MTQISIQTEPRRWREFSLLVVADSGWGARR